MDAKTIMSLISGGVNLLSPIAGLFAHGFKGLKKSFQSMSDAATGYGLTGAQRESNAFEAQQAQKQMNFQQQMRDTQYQSAVADMKEAGVNPALAMSNGGNSAPQGAMASSESSGTPDIVGLLGQMANLRLINSQKRLIDAQTESEKSMSELNKQRKKNLGLDFDIAGLKYEKDSIELKYFERLQQIAIESKEQDIAESKKRIDDINSVIAKRGYEVQKMFFEVMETMANIQLMKARTDLTEKEKEKLDHDIKEVDARIGLISAQTGIARKDIEYYGVNHIAAGATGVVKSAGRAIKRLSSKTGKKMTEKLSERILGDFTDDILGVGTNPYYIAGE